MSKSWGIAAICVFLLVGSAGNVAAKTPDGQPPSVETVCDNEHGAAYGLCVAYCEAMDCMDPRQRASNQGCESVRRNFERHTGRPIPCSVKCPCGDMLQLFNDLSTGQVRALRCIVYPTLLYVQTTAGDLALIDDGPPISCNVNDEPPFIELTPAERSVCRVNLINAVQAQGVTCGPPE